MIRSAKDEGAVKRIAFVTDSVHPYNKGGKETRLYEISRRLVRANQEVHIYTMKWWDGPKVITLEGVYFHAISKNYPLYTKGRRSISQALLFGLATSNLIFERFDVLDVDHMPFYPLFVARVVTWLKRKRLIATWHEVWGHDYWHKYLNGPVGIFGSITEWLSFRLPDLIISNSNHTTAKLKLAGVTKPIVTVPLGVDIKAVYEATPSQEKTDVIYVGRLLAHKNVALLIEAIGIVKDTRRTISCIVIGDGPERKRLDTLVTKLKLQSNVTLTGFVADNAEIYGYMKSSKVLVLPSVREGFGLVIVEANAANIPVITINDPGNAAANLIRDGENGYLSTLTSKSIAAKIEAVLANKSSFNPRRGIEHYDWSLVATSYEEAILGDPVGASKK